jgi:hypothetical protein
MRTLAILDITASPYKGGFAVAWRDAAKHPQLGSEVAAANTNPPYGSIEEHVTAFLHYMRGL